MLDGTGDYIAVANDPDFDLVLEHLVSKDETYANNVLN